MSTVNLKEGFIIQFSNKKKEPVSVTNHEMLN